MSPQNIEHIEEMGMRYPKRVIVYLDQDELYPYYHVTTLQKGGNRWPSEVDAETVARWRRTMDDFEQVQTEMFEAYAQNRDWIRKA